MNILILGAGGLEVLLVQSCVFVTGDGVIRLVHTALVGGRVLEGNHGLRRLVVEEILVFADTREIIVFGVVHHGIRLEELTIVFAEVQLDAPVWQVAELPAHELVHGAGVEDAPVAALFLHVVPRGVQLHYDVFVVEHAFEHGGVAILRDALPAVLEVAVVAAHIDGHTAGHSGVEVFGLHAPLLHRVDEEDFLIDVLREEVEVGVVGLAQFEDGNFFVEAEAFHQFFFETGGKSLGEDLADGVQVEGDGHELAVDEAHHLVHIRIPVGEARSEVPRGLDVRVEDVRAVLMYADAVGIPVIVAVAADMRLAVDDKHLLAAFGKHSSHGCAGNAGTYNDILHADAPCLFSMELFRTSASVSGL